MELSITRRVVTVQGNTYKVRHELVRRPVEVTRNVGGVVAHTTFVHSQNTPAATWTVAHNLNRYPTAVVVDTGGTVHQVGVEYLNANTVRVTMAAPLAGFLYLN